jgi:exodeoxyribonuclease VII large subunit
MSDLELVMAPVEFVALANQTLEHVFGRAVIEGELSNFRVSKGKWLYFDLKDEYAKVSCFASVYALPGPLEDGMVVRISGTPRLHPQFGFSVTVQTITPAGEGSIKKAYELLKLKLTGEGLFDADKKRTLPEIPTHIALVASVESAAYADFMKILQARWPFMVIDVYDTQVQGEAAPEQLVQAITKANRELGSADALIVTRGGGSADDLSAFNDERVVRALSASRIPTLVAIGHEIDESFAELVADVRASTPSNAAELLVPDRSAELRTTASLRDALNAGARGFVDVAQADTKFLRERTVQGLTALIKSAQADTASLGQLLAAYNPRTILQRGYALVRSNDVVVTASGSLAVGDVVSIELGSGAVEAQVTKVRGKL